LEDCSEEEGAASERQERRTHVKATSDASALEGLVLSILLAGLHETGHLILGKLDLAELELAKTLNKAS
jgi:hypothetical protein